MSSDSLLERCGRFEEIRLGWDYEATLYTLAIGVRANLIYETGVGGGLSTHAFLCVMPQTQGKLVSCDIADRSKVVSDERLAKAWEFHQMDALDFAKALTEQADLIYIDDWHRYDHVSEELRAFWPLLKSDGLMVLHDTRHYREQVWTAVLDFEEPCEKIELPYAHGFAVLHKKGYLP